MHESRKGETFILGATTWRIEEITRDRVIVIAGAGRARQDAVLARRRAGPPDRARPRARRVLPRARRRLGAIRTRRARGCGSDYRLDAFAADNLVALPRASSARRPASVPTDRAITIERFRDELGDVRVCILSPFGAACTRRGRWCSSAQLEAATLGYPVQPLWTDDGIALRFADGDALPDGRRS